MKKALFLALLAMLTLPAMSQSKKYKKAMEAAKPIFLEAQEKFKTFQNEDPFWPAWGEELNQGELDRLNE